MSITRCQKIQQKVSPQHILKIITRRKTKNSCEEEDCCGNIIEKCKPNIVIERTCHPCSFYTWKPKLPNLLCPPKPKVVEKPRKRMKCHAGMVIPKPKSFTQIKKEAAQCFKECGAKPVCPPKAKPLTKKSYDTYCPPRADWDHEGHME